MRLFQWVRRGGWRGQNIIGGDPAAPDLVSASLLLRSLNLFRFADCHPGHRASTAGSTTAGIAHYRKPAPALYDLSGLVESGFLSDGDGLLVVTSSTPRAWVRTYSWAKRHGPSVRGQALRVQQVEPPRPLADGAGFAAAQEISFGDHTNQTGSITGTPLTDMVLQHQPDGFFQMLACSAIKITRVT
jgi:hypothetical protein